MTLIWSIMYTLCFTPFVSIPNDATTTSDLCIAMNFLIDFLHQEVPKSGQMPAYYRKALFISEIILVGYFVASFALLFITTGVWLWPPVVIIVVAMFCLMDIDHLNPRLSVAHFAALIFAWLAWFVHRFGWSAGSPNILVPILAMVFFNIYVPPLSKIAYFLGLVGFRILLFAWSLHHTPAGVLNASDNLILQIVNSVVPLSMLVIEFILFSFSIQASERALTINNLELHREAGTDPLTALPNRRALLDEIEQYQRDNPTGQFSVAIADIDFFKKVNDTYGHTCGDYALKELSALFMECAADKYKVCRWGGEEFCFFLPGMNIDEAGQEMTEVNIAVRKRALHFGEMNFSITITIGVEENDFQSTLEQILDRADRKLYMGKVGGRDRVVI